MLNDRISGKCRRHDVPDVCQSDKDEKGQGLNRGFAVMNSAEAAADNRAKAR
jgi:hypothetical protein